MDRSLMAMVHGLPKSEYSQYQHFQHPKRSRVDGGTKTEMRD